KLQILPSLLPAAQQCIPVISQRHKLLLDIRRGVVLARQQFFAQVDAG
ncbi:unnamed protein product, partial [Plutella xylostella]